MSDKTITFENWVCTYRLDALDSIIREIVNKYDNTNVSDPQTIYSLAEIYNSKLQEIPLETIQEHDPQGSFIKGSHKYPSYTSFYIMMVNGTHCYSVGPKEIFERIHSRMSHRNITYNMKNNIDILNKKGLKPEYIFNILKQVEDTLKTKLIKFDTQLKQMMSVPLLDWDWTKYPGGSRKRRKSICKNYNKKCKHYTKKYKLKHKIKHKNTNRQKYQKQK